MNTDLQSAWPFSFAELRAGYRNGAFTPTDVVSHCWERIARLEPVLGAWVQQYRDESLRIAAEQTARFRAGSDVGSLAGIPLGVKDIFDIAGHPTWAGSRSRFQHVAKQTAPSVKLLTHDGAIVLGKTVTTEFAAFDPPPTRNPYDLTRTPGGSSSGSAVAVAAGMCTFALGSQTGGSLTRPAAYCGIAAWKPTHNTFSTDGVIELAGTLDHVGWLARTATDLHDIAQALGVIRPISAGERSAAKLIRVAWLQGFFVDAAEPAVQSVVAGAVDRLRAAGFAIEATALPYNLPEWLTVHRQIMYHEAALAHLQTFPAQRALYGPKIAAVLDEGHTIGPGAYQTALARRKEIIAAVLKSWGDVDAWLCPAAPNLPPEPSTTGDARFNCPWSLLGFPTVSFPAGLSESGLPVGLQLVGLPGEDRQLLGVASQLEIALALPRLLPPMPT